MFRPIWTEICFRELSQNGTPPMAKASHEQFKRIISSMLRPLVRVSLRYLVPYQEFSSLVRQEYVRLAAQMTNPEGKRLNLSRIAVVTGIHRREVKAALETEGNTAPRSLNTITKLLNIWLSDPRFCFSKGRPRALGFRGRDNPFRALVREVAVSVDAGAILKELVRLGHVSLRERKAYLEARTNVFHAKQNLPRALEYLHDESNRLLQATLENLARDEGTTPHVILRTRYDNIPPERLKEIKEWFQRRADALHHEVNEYLSHFDRDTGAEASLDDTSLQRIEACFSTVSYAGISENTGQNDPKRPR